MTLKELRSSYEITQSEAANSVGVPLRTYVRYESNENSSNLKHQKIVELLKEKYEFSENKGKPALQKAEIEIKILFFSASITL